MIQDDDLKKVLRREGTLLVVLVFVGFVVLPAAIYFVGFAVFGEYENGGFGAFFADLQRELRSGNLSALFLLFSPWLLWQLLRLVVGGFRRLGPPGPPDA